MSWWESRLYVCTDTAWLYTEAAKLNGLPFESTSTSLGISSTPVSWIIAKCSGQEKL